MGDYPKILESLEKKIQIPTNFKPHTVFMHQKNRNRVYKFQSNKEEKTNKKQRRKNEEKKKLDAFEL